MAGVQLKQIQQYRNTIIFLVILGGIAVLFLLSYLITTSNVQKKSPLAPSPLPPTAAFGSLNPQALAIKWDDVRIGKTREEIQKVLGKESKVVDQSGTSVVYYQSLTPNVYHTVKYQDNKAIYILREVNERQEKIVPDYFKTLYGEPEILQQGFGDLYQLEAYKVNNNEYVIITLDIRYNNIYQITNMTKAEYDKYKEAVKKSTFPPDENEFEGNF